MSVAAKNGSASTKLEGMTLPNGWKVVRRVLRNPNGSGGMFSHCYQVEKDGQRGFLKAFDFSAAFEPGTDAIRHLQIMTSAFEHERDILEICKEKRLSKVVIAIDHGQVQVDGFGEMEGRVYFLVFELADGDIRSQVDESARFNCLWSLRALRDVSLGLWQIHCQMVAHQDVKPSNVLVFKTAEGFRISDFGRSSLKGRSVWYDDADVAGDKQYSPPELLYGFRHPEFSVRRIGCDLYMLGNLAVFMSAGVNVTAMLLARLEPQFHWSNWHGQYEQVLSYVVEAFTRVLEDIAPLIDEDVREDILDIVRDLCHPDVQRRGHPRERHGYSAQSLERYVSRLDLLCRRLEIKQRMRRLAG